MPLRRAIILTVAATLLMTACGADGSTPQPTGSAGAPAAPAGGTGAQATGGGAPATPQGGAPAGALIPSPTTVSQGQGPRSGTKVDFLLDGTEFFGAMYDELQRVKNSSETGAYVHLGFWAADHRVPLTRLAGGGPGVSLEAELKAVANAGHPVKVILWDPTGFASVLFSSVDQTNNDFYNALNGYNSGLIQVRLEEYGSNQGQHQKMAIFAGDPEPSESDPYPEGIQVRTIIAGLNLYPGYWDEPGHPGTFYGIQHSWHDTAVLLEGPATLTAQEEWNRRWRKVEPVIPPEGPSGGKAVIGGSSVEVAITDVENGKKEILSQLLTAINNANDYIYLENYMIIEPTLVNAIAKRMSQVPSLVVIIMLPGSAWGAEVERWLHYLTYTELAIAGADQVVVGVSGVQQTLDRSLFQVWRVHQPNDAGDIPTMKSNPWLADSAFEWGASAQSVQRVPLSAVNQIRSRFFVTTPVRYALQGSTVIQRPLYLHSKLALIDDVIAIIGSANFDYRSLHYDAEMSAVITDATKVREIRQRLFDEWNMTDAASWYQKATANLRSQVTFDRVYVIPESLPTFASATGTIGSSGQSSASGGSSGSSSSSSSSSSGSSSGSGSFTGWLWSKLISTVADRTFW